MPNIVFPPSSPLIPTPSRLPFMPLPSISPLPPLRKRQVSHGHEQSMAHQFEIEPSSSPCIKAG